MDSRIGPSLRIGAITLFRTAARALQKRAREVAALWFVWAAAAAAAALLGLDVLAAGFTPAALACNGFYSVLSGLGSVIGLRILLEAPGRWRVIDAAFVKAAGIYSAITMVFGVWTIGLDAMFARAPVPFLGIGMGILLLVALFLMVKLTLWPIAILTRRQGVDLQGAWKMMQGATAGYVIANTLVLLPLLIASGVGAFAVGDEESRGLNALLEATTILISLGGLALSAALYALRVERSSALAEVFD